MQASDSRDGAGTDNSPQSRPTAVLIIGRPSLSPLISTALSFATALTREQRQEHVERLLAIPASDAPPTVERCQGLGFDYCHIYVAGEMATPPVDSLLHAMVSIERLYEAGDIDEDGAALLRRQFTLLRDFTVEGSDRHFGTTNRFFEWDQPDRRRFLATHYPTRFKQGVGLE